MWFFLYFIGKTCSNLFIQKQENIIKRCYLSVWPLQASMRYILVMEKDVWDGVIP